MQDADDWSEWIRTAADERAVEQGCWFDLAAAERVRALLPPFLRHSKGQWAGQPFELLDWQWRDVVAPLFGWKRTDGTRRFRRGYIEVPKKNGKSTLFAGLSLYTLTCDSEPGPRFTAPPSTATRPRSCSTRRPTWSRARRILSSRLNVVRSTKRIVDHTSKSFYRALSADVPAKEGLNAHAVLIDELHAQKTRDLWDTLRYAGASRRQPLHLSITTAGFDRHSICWEQHDYALKVFDGTVQDPAFFAYIAAAADDDDWTDPAIWRKANPSFRRHDRCRAVRRGLPRSAGVARQGELLPPLPAQPVDRAGCPLAEDGEVGRLRR